MDDTKKEIQYPCTWHYRIIGEDRDALHKAAVEIIEKDFVHSAGLVSKGGKYHSIHLEVEVSHKEERDSIFVALQKDARIKFVL